MKGFKLIQGQRQVLEEKVIDLVLDSFKPDSNYTHEYLISQIERLEPRGDRCVHLVDANTAAPVTRGTVGK